MNGKDRIKKALAFERCDRLPVSYEAEWEVTKALCNNFGLNRNKFDVVNISSFHSPLGERIDVGIDHEIALQNQLGVDLSKVACPINPENTIGNWFGLPIKYKREDGILIGAWEMQFIEKEYGAGKYIEFAGYPLAHEQNNEVFENWPMPDIDLYNYRLLAEVLPKHEKFYVILNMNGCFDISRYIRGTEDFLMDMLLDPVKAEILMDKTNEFALSYLDHCMAAGSGLIDGVYCGDDFGTQNALLIGPELFRKYIKPRYKKLIERVHSYDLKYFHHSCGAIREIIPDLIEIGVDVLNPIQPRAAGMEPERLAREFGKDIVFYGGIDEQHTLPYGSTEDVQKEVLHCMETLGRYGNYIVAPAHGFQCDTPIDNILALYQAAGSFKPE